MTYVAPPQCWHILQPKGENEFMPWQHWIGMEPPGTYGEEHGVRIMRHRGAMRPRHYVLKMADYDKRDDPLG
jgi:hypothetical protein